MKTPKTILRQARALVAKGWTQDRYAADKWRHEVDFDSPSACRFCASGAIRRVSIGSPVTQAYDLMDRAAGPDHAGFVAFNDYPGRTKAEVLAMFDRAIKAAP